MTPPHPDLRFVWLYLRVHAPRESGSAAVSLKEKEKQNGVRRRGGGGNTPKRIRIGGSFAERKRKTKWRQT